MFPCTLKERALSIRSAGPRTSARDQLPSDDHTSSLSKVGIFLHSHNPVHDDVLYPRRVQVRVCICGPVQDRILVEDHEVGPHPGLDQPPIECAYLLGGSRCHLSDGFFKTEQSRLSHVSSEDSGEGPIGSRVRPPLPMADAPKVHMSLQNITSGCAMMAWRSWSEP